MHKFTMYFAALIIAVLTASTAPAQQTIPPLPELQFAEIQAKEKFTGDRWSYLEAGPKDAPVIVTLHGLGDNAMQWRFQLAGLSDRFRVIAWNAPGYMLTDGFKTERPGCQDYADALADFLDALKLTRVNLLGNSFGSRVSQCFAMNYPARVNKLVFVGPSAGRKGMTEQEKEQYIVGRKEQVAQGGYNFPDNRVSALLNTKATPELIELTSYALRAVDPRGFMHGSYFAIAESYSPEEVGAKVTAPLLLIVGDEDRVSPIAAHAEPLHKAIRGSRLEILKGIGHLPHVEAPDKVNQMAREFFGSSTTQSPAPPSSDEADIRQIIQEQENGWNRGSAKDYAASFQAEGSFTIITGTLYRSRAALETRMVEIFSTIYKDSKVANRIQTIRFVRPDVAIVDLETEVTGFQGLPSGVKGAGQNKLLTSMLQVLVKERGQWAVAAFHNVDVKTR